MKCEVEKHQVIVDRDAFDRCIEELNKYQEVGTVQELAELAQAKAEGRLVVLPCNAGDILYSIDKRRNNHGTHDLVIVENKIWGFEIETPEVVWTRTDKYHFRPEMLGKTVFLTREAAEAALKQNGGGQG